MESAQANQSCCALNPSERFFKAFATLPNCARCRKKIEEPVIVIAKRDAMNNGQLILSRLRVSGKERECIFIRQPSKKFL